MRKKKSPVPVIAGVIAAAVIVGIGGFAVNRYAPTDERIDSREYYGLTGESQAALVVNGQVLEEKGLLSDGIIYIDYQTVWELF